MVTSANHYADILNPADMQTLCDEAQQQGQIIYEQVGAETRFNLPQRLGRGGESEFHLRNGISFVIRDAALWRSIRLRNHHGQSPPLISKFHLSGNSRVLTPNVASIPDDYREVAGCNYLYYLPNVTEIEEWYEGETIYLVMVLIPPDTLQTLDQDCDCLPNPLRRLVQGDLTTRFHQPLGQTSPAMLHVIRQVLQCPYQGMMKQLYLESKALELLTLQFTNWAENAQTSRLHFLEKSGPRLRADDVERLYQVREILRRQMDNPPSLMALARQVGLDDCKLKWGFRRLFGTTVFGYLHEYRMERARQLLAAGQMSVTEVAHTVGYSSLPSFSKAFRKRFGSSPSQLPLR
jgi:AraC-like DNA-binding protein